MKLHRRKVVRAPLALVAVLGLTLASCSSGGDEGSQPPGSNTAGTSDASGGGSVNRDGTARIGFDLAAINGGQPFTIDPAKMTWDQNDAIVYMIYGRLLRPTPSGDLVPDLAESATVTDPNTITIALRPDLTWQDGTPYDAEAVRAGLQRSLDARNVPGFTDAFFTVKGMQVTGPLNLTISFEGNAAAWYDTFLGSWQSTIVKPGETNFDTPVGAGPMQVSSFTRDTELTLERWDGYWNAEETNFAGMQFVQIPSGSPQSSTAALQAGQVDVAQTTVDQFAAFSGDIEELVIPNANRVVNMTICKKDGPLADARVRKAVNKAIDRESIDEVLYQGTAPAATEFWPEGDRFYTEDVGEELAYDPEAAKQLLEEAGYADGVSFDLYAIDANGLDDVAVAIQPQLAEVGIDVNIIVTSNYVADWLTSGKPGMGLSPGGNANRGKLNAWTGESITNVCQYDDPELNSIVQQFSSVSDNDAEAVELWDQANTIISNDALSVPLLFGSTLGARDVKAIHLEADGVWPRGIFVVPDLYTSYML